MNTIEEKIGYLVAKMEELGADVKTLTQSQNTLEQGVNELKARVDEKFKLAEITFKVLKFLALTIAAILSFKFGDVSSLWRQFFG